MPALHELRLRTYRSRAAALSEEHEGRLAAGNGEHEVRRTDKLADELHKPARRHFRKRRVLVRGIDAVWAVDLIDMQHYAKDSDNFRFILAVIDVFSKFGWMRLLKQKTGVEVAHALNDITSGVRRLVQVWCDKGLEFYNRHVKKLVDLISSENEQKSSVVERWNLSMKQRMLKYFTANNTRRYFDVLSDMVSQYSNTKHSAIKMTPVQASNPENLYRTYMNLYGDIVHDNSPKPKPKLAVGDKIRITVKKDVFRKGYLPRWTEELIGHTVH
jgi:hypothetical protein